MLVWEILTAMHVLKKTHIEGKHKVSEEEQTVQINMIKYNRDCVSVKRRYIKFSIKFIDLLSTNTLRNAVRRRHLLFFRSSNW